MRRLAGSAPPVLAAEGNTLAVGIQLSLRRMGVLLIQMPSGRVRGRFDLPDGMLAFADAHRLVVSRRSGAPFPIVPEVDVGGGTISAGNIGSGPFHSTLYSTTGRRLQDLGTSTQPPLVSGDHIITVSRDLVAGTDILRVRNVSTEHPTLIVGFHVPGRTLLASALRWPYLAMIETTSAALPNGQFSCRYGTYTAPSSPFVRTVDLAATPQFDPAPTPPPQPAAEQVFAALRTASPVVGRGTHCPSSIKAEARALFSAARNLRDR